jgi:hypothetical protein
MTFVFVGTVPYPVETVEQISAAVDAMFAAVLLYSPVLVGDPTGDYAANGQFIALPVRGLLGG